MSRYAAAIVIAVVLLAARAAAEGQTAPSPATIDTAVHSGNKVVVGIKGGATRKGTVFTVSPTSLELLVDKHKETISAGDIWVIKIEYVDRLTDGVKKGALIGLIAGLSFGLALVAEDCGNGGSYCTAGGFLAAAGMMGGFGTGIGAGVGAIGDASQKSTRVVWPVPASPSRIAVNGLAHGTGARVVIRW